MLLVVVDCVVTVVVVTVELENGVTSWSTPTTSLTLAGAVSDVVLMMDEGVLGTEVALGVDSSGVVKITLVVVVGILGMNGVGVVVVTCLVKQKFWNEVQNQRILCLSVACRLFGHHTPQLHIVQSSSVACRLFMFKFVEQKTFYHSLKSPKHNLQTETAWWKTESKQHFNDYHDFILLTI